MLKLRGSKRVTKEREASEPTAPAGTPDRPDWLDADARKAWDELVPMLEAMGVLTRVDGNALARYCRLWSRWRKAEAFIDERGEMYPLKDDAGKVKCFQQWPQVAIAHRLALQLTKLEAEFGMTPSARTRIQLAPQAKEQAHGKARFFEAG
jgi:P27 family predicted phage terminase small subunit